MLNYMRVMEMTSEEFQTIGLYDHNADSYRMVRNAYESGKNVLV